MPSNSPHKILLQRLNDIMSVLQKALDKNDFKSLASLSADHQIVFEKLKEAGSFDDPKSVTLLKNTIARIDSISEELNNRKKKIGRQLAVSGNKKKILTAYQTKIHK